MAHKDYYKILGVEKNSSADEIKKAFRQLARKHHPDVNQGNKESEEKFKEINEAFQVLGNSEKKQQYDQYGDSAFNQEDLRNYRNQNFSFEDLFSNGGFGDLFNMFSGRGEEEDYEEGADLRFDVEISLEEAFEGIKKEIELDIQEICDKCGGEGAESKDMKICNACQGSGRVKSIKRQGFTQFVSVSPCRECGGRGKIISKHCSKCHGSGKISERKKIEINIPKGVDHGQYLKIPGKGHLGRNAPAGDLYVVVHLTKHSVFRREGADLFSEKKIDLMTAISGGKIEIEGLGKKLKISLPAGTQSHTHFRLDGQGMPELNSRSRGDLFVNIIVEIPKLDRKKEKKIKEILE